MPSRYIYGRLNTRWSIAVPHNRETELACVSSMGQKKQLLINVWSSKASKGYHWGTGKIGRAFPAPNGWKKATKVAVRDIPLIDVGKDIQNQEGNQCIYRLPGGPFIRQNSIWGNEAQEPKPENLDKVAIDMLLGLILCQLPSRHLLIKLS